MHYSAFVYVLLAGYGMVYRHIWHAMEYVWRSENEKLKELALSFHNIGPRN